MTIVAGTVPAGPGEIFGRRCAEKLIGTVIAVPASRWRGTLVRYEVRKNGRELYLEVDVPEGAMQ